MPQLEIEYSDGRRETAPLSRTSPLTIGAQSFNDIAVPGDGVAAFHCRIGWNKTGFEVTAATSKGVDLNGTIVEHAFLKPGDILRIGPCDVTYAGDSTDPSPPPKKKEEPKLGRGGEARSKSKPPPPPPVSPESDDVSLFEGAVVAESMDELSVSDLVSQSEAELPLLPRGRGAAEAYAGSAGKPAHELPTGRVRPGEQEPFKSPLVLTLGGGGVVLLLIAGTLWFLMGREVSTNMYSQAEKDLAAGKYTQAIEQFENFIKTYPRSSNVLPARINSAKARVQKELTGGAPAWNLAWERLEELVKEFRSSESYDELLPAIRGFSEEVAIGAAKTAEQLRDESLLPISASATQLLERSADPETPLGPALTRIQSATAKAETAIAKQKTRDAAVTRMQGALTAKQPIDALAERETLLRKFPDYRRDRGVEDVLQQALKLELSTVVVSEVDRPAQKEAAATAALSVLPVLHARSRTSDASLGRLVWVLAQDSCYAVDTMTGEPTWRRVIGFDPPFSPVDTRGEVPGWLMYDRRTGELVHCRIDNGTTLWRQSLGGEPSGSPLIDEGQVYVVTKNREMLRIDLEMGTVSALLTFSQGITGPPVLDATRQFLFVTGNRGLIYALRKRPLECAAVTFTDHGAGAVPAPLTSLGRLLLLADNDQASSSRLRLWDAADPSQPLPPEGESRVSGQVYDAPVLRGPHLVVPLQGERLTAFVVNDEAGRSEFKEVGTYRVQDGYTGPMHVVLGPDQQFWLSSTAFRRFEIAADSVRLDPNFVAVGLTAQPLQSVGETFFVGRRARYAEGVQFTNIDRNSLTGTWRTVLGARPKAALLGAGGNVVLITESGIVFNIGASRLAQGGIEQGAATDLDWPAALHDPPLIARRTDGGAVVATGGSTPRVWFVESTGRVAPPADLAAPLECPPLDLAPGLVLPTAGRLSLRHTQGSQKFEDWRAPVEAEQPSRWAHLLRTGEDEFLAINADGRCHRLQVRMGDIPHLAEVAAIDGHPPAVVPPVTLGESIVMVDVDHRVRRLNQRTLEPAAEWAGGGPILGLTTVEQQLLVWDADTLRMLDGETLAEVWALPLNGRLPVGQPVLRGARLWWGCEQGEVLSIERSSGRESPQAALPQALSLGVIAIGDALWGVACDATLYRLPDPQEGQP